MVKDTLLYVSAPPKKEDILAVDVTLLRLGSSWGSRSTLLVRAGCYDQHDGSNVDMFCIDAR